LEAAPFQLEDDVPDNTIETDVVTESTVSFDFMHLLITCNR